jgi:hypothetical protein
VKGQTNAAQNGIYVTSSSGAGTRGPCECPPRLYGGWAVACDRIELVSYLLEWQQDMSGQKAYNEWFIRFVEPADNYVAMRQVIDLDGGRDRD